MKDRPSRAPTTPLYLQGMTAPLVPPYQDYLVLVRPEQLVENAETRRQREALWEEFCEQGRFYVDYFARHREQLSARIRLLSFVLEIYRQPTAQWPPLLQALRPDHRQLAQLLLEQLADPGILRRVSIAVSRFDEAARAVREVEECLEAIAGLTAEAAHPRFSTLSIPKLKGKLYLLSTFGLLFKRDPILNRMFPDAAAEAPKPAEKPASGPARPDREKPPRPAPKSTETLPNPPPKEGFFSEMLRKLKPPPA